MIALVPMSDESYADYLKAAVLNYAQENIEAGRWPKEGALARSQADFENLLANGIETPNHYLFDIKTVEADIAVGIIWVAVEKKYGIRSAFIYDVEIKPEFRRQGYAKAAFEALELFIRELGISSIGLHVFGHNLGAQALYHKLGYEITGINMQKSLDK